MNLSVMIVDDESASRQFLAAALRKMGIELIIEASNAIDGIKTFAKQPVDLMFLDLNMPGENGFALLSALRAQQKNVRIVIISAAGDLENVQKAIRLGADGFIVKPFKLAKVQESVAVCRKAKASRP